MIIKIKTIFMLLLFSCFSQFSQARLFEAKDPAYYEDISEFSDKVSQMVLILTAKDLKVIDKYLENLYQIKIYERLRQDQLKDLFKALELALNSNLIPKSKLKQIRRMSIAALGFEFSKRIRKRVRNILWWIEVRSFQHQEDLFSFLELQISKGSNENIIKILIEKGQLAEKVKWFKKSKPKRLSDKILISNRHKDIIVGFDNNSENLAKLLISSYKNSLSKLLSNFEDNSELEIQHLDWLLLQMNLNKRNPKVKNILTKISKDWMTYNYKDIDGLSKTSKVELISKLKAELNIKTKLSHILNSSKISIVDTSK